MATIGIKSFNKELFEDLEGNPVRYILSLCTGMFTYFNIPVVQEGLVTTELIKMIFSIITAAFVVAISFIIKKIIEPLWEQKMKPYIYKKLKIK